MKRKFSYAIFYLLVFFLLGFAVMFLWNDFLPSIIHIPKITYWQALGLMLLCRILFGKFRFGGWMDWQQHGSSRFLKDKLINMDESDKARFKEEWRKRCEGRERNET
jgi:hypothetical protein